MSPWDDRGDGHPSDTTLLNTLAHVLVAHGLLTHAKGVPASASSQPSHTITCSMFPWDDRGDGRPTDTTLLNTLAPVLVAHGLLTHGTTKLPFPATKRTKN
ncbi:hypothetical protein PoB_005623500 [Plakobranchus ocellatus]|uniref:Uncharacterized protein n=1 Tax=Plakobranchus ocellatus TaxID=259542 RepID=A0AAV4CE70_9GAST|nr:hypothetical protein PoB_005623500 [Plakobranchus ocellatus]